MKRLIFTPREVNEAMLAYAVTKGLLVMPKGKTVRCKMSQETSFVDDSTTTMIGMTLEVEIEDR